MKRSTILLAVCGVVVVSAATYYGVARRGLQPADATRGRQVFDARCWVCHETDNEGYRIGPGLQNYFRRSPHQQKNGSEHEHTDEFVREFIRNGSMNMPAQNDFISQQELADVMAYLKTL